MKTSSYVVLISFALFVSCTDRGSAESSFTDITRIISNESGHQVRIKSYFNQVDPPLDTIVQINLKNGESHTAKAVYKRGFLDNSGIYDGLIETLISVDSVVVVFDNEKYAIHCSLLTNPFCTVKTINRNIILDNLTKLDGMDRGYELTNNGKNSRTWFYAITQQDYENAIDCNGSPRCEE